MAVNSRLDIAPLNGLERLAYRAISGAQFQVAECSPESTKAALAGGLRFVGLSQVSAILRRVARAEVLVALLQLQLARGHRLLVAVDEHRQRLAGRFERVAWPHHHI